MKPYYEEAGITIYHGDCREILPTLPKVDLVLTDPPYGLGKKMQGGTWGAQDHNSGFLVWDLEAPHWFPPLISGLDSIIWGGNYLPLPPSRCWLIWNKINAVPTMADFEMAWTNLDKPSKRIDLPVGRVEYGHPTQKPLRLITWCLSQAPETVHTVLDPFMGSGTTLVACKQAGLICTGIELEERYCEIAANRLRQGVLWGIE